MDPDQNILSKYYTNNTGHYLAIFGQKGGALAHFRGMPVQRGSGMLSDIFVKYAVPILARAVPHVVKGVRNILSDVDSGKSFRKSVNRNAVSTVKRVGRSLLTGKGRAKKRNNKKRGKYKKGRIVKKKPKKKVKKLKRKKTYKIFD